MKHNLQKKLLSYSTLAAVILGVDRSAEAQIIYTKIDPPDTLTSDNSGFYYGSYLLDLNNDGISDFRFSIFTFQQNTTHESFFNDQGEAIIYATAIGSNKFDADTALNYGASICSQRKWQTQQNLASSHNHWYNTDIKYPKTFRFDFLSGPFVNDTNKYLPLKLVVNGANYYGWVRLSVAPWASALIISGYAYNTIPGTCINTGDSTTSISNSPIENETSIWSVNRNVYVKLGNNSSLGSTLNIYNTLGQKVFSSTISTLQTEIELNNPPAGIYIVRLEGKESSVVKKISIKY